MMTKTVKTDTPKSANGGCKVDVEEEIVITFMLLRYMMMTNKIMHTKTSLAMVVRIAMMIDPVLFSTWFRTTYSFCV